MLVSALPEASLYSGAQAFKISACLRTNAMGLRACVQPNSMVWYVKVTVSVSEKSLKKTSG